VVLDCDPTTFAAGGCTDTEDFGTVLKLQATPNAGFKFVNYAGGICNGVTNATCVSLLQGNVTVTPHFQERTVVTVSKPGNGSGSIVSTPPGINCGQSST